jgi:ribA/ribD-fused uncharacterized protein
MQKKKIKFYRVNEKPFGCFSNFYKITIKIDSKTWHNVEHYHQAMKFSEFSEIIELIRNPSNPMEVKILANNVYANLVSWENWDKIKIGIMYKAIKAKFEQHED